jgi:hypothetical protein
MTWFSIARDHGGLVGTILGVDFSVTTRHLSLGWSPRDTTLDLHWGNGYGHSPAHLRYSALDGDGADDYSWTTIHWMSTRYSKEEILEYFDLEGYDGGAGRPFAWTAQIKRGYWLCKATQRGGLDI